MNDKTSLWKLLEKYEIVIPIIQRDYAQGRKNKEGLRYRFLSSLIDALQNNLEMTLDFVYGGVQNGQMAPLDGQQRLTTLWLLHWYIAFRAGKLKDEDVRKRLKRFYYATRPSSTDFCRRLVDEFNDGNAEKENDITDYIRDQHWYFSYYNNDPTIQAMLMMIKGDRRKDEKGNEKEPNGLEQFFGTNCDYEGLWNSLIGEECPIQFYHLDMVGENAPLMDDLYIKMNARGKQLTPFENFKAELIGYNNGDFVLDINDNEDQQFVSNLDNSWMNIFWPYKHKLHFRVDEIYYKFVCQMMLGYYLVKSDIKEIGKTRLYDLLSSASVFNKIEDYKDVLDGYFKEMFYNTLNGVAKFANYASSVKNKDINSCLENILGYYLSFNKIVHFIPLYDYDKKAEDLDYSPTETWERIPQVLFFAICRFFEKWNKIYCNDNWNDEASARLKDWVRFCYNVSYNPRVNSVDSMRSAMQVIYEISKILDCLNIYESLSGIESFDEINLKSNVAKAQIEEEFYKAKYQNDYLEIRDEFIEAEQYSFFKGCIRFLLWNEQGEYRLDKNTFGAKLEKVLKLFDKGDTFEGKIKNKGCFKAYICACDKIEEILSNDNYGTKSIRFDNSGEAWKSILANKYLCAPTHRFLMEETEQSMDALRQKLLDSLPENDYENLEVRRKRLNYVLDVILEDEFMTNLERMSDMLNNVLFLRKNNGWALYPFNARADWKVIILGKSRNMILKQLLDENYITTKRQVGSSNMFYGWNVPFTYNNKEFIWRWDNKIVGKDLTNPIDAPFDVSYEEIKRQLEVHSAKAVTNVLPVAE